MSTSATRIIPLSETDRDFVTSSAIPTSTTSTLTSEMSTKQATTPQRLPYFRLPVNTKNNYLNFKPNGNIRFNAPVSVRSPIFNINGPHGTVRCRIESPLKKFNSSDLEFLKLQRSHAVSSIPGTTTKLSIPVRLSTSVSSAVANSNSGVSTIRPTDISRIQFDKLPVIIRGLQTSKIEPYTVQMKIPTTTPVTPPKKPGEFANAESNTGVPHVLNTSPLLKNNIQPSILSRSPLKLSVSPRPSILRKREYPVIRVNSTAQRNLIPLLSVAPPKPPPTTSAAPVQTNDKEYSTTSAINELFSFEKKNNYNTYSKMASTYNKMVNSNNNAPGDTPNKNDSESLSSKNSRKQKLPNKMNCENNQLLSNESKVKKPERYFSSVTRDEDFDIDSIFEPTLIKDKNVRTLEDYKKSLDELQARQTMSPPRKPRKPRVSKKTKMTATGDVPRTKRTYNKRKKLQSNEVGEMTNETRITSGKLTNEVKTCGANSNAPRTKRVYNKRKKSTADSEYTAPVTKHPFMKKKMRTNLNTIIDAKRITPSMIEKLMSRSVEVAEPNKVTPSPSSNDCDNTEKLTSHQTVLDESKISTVPTSEAKKDPETPALFDPPPFKRPDSATRPMCIDEYKNLVIQITAKEIMSPRKKPRKQQLCKTISSLVEDKIKLMNTFDGTITQIQRAGNVEESVTSSVTNKSVDKSVSSESAPSLPISKPRKSSSKKSVSKSKNRKSTKSLKEVKVLKPAESPKKAAKKSKPKRTKLMRNHFLKDVEMLTVYEKKPTLTEFVNRKENLKKADTFRLNLISAHFEDLMTDEIEAIFTLRRYFDALIFKHANDKCLQLIKIQKLICHVIRRCNGLIDSFIEGKESIGEITCYRRDALEIYEKFANKDFSIYSKSNGKRSICNYSNYAYY